MPPPLVPRDDDDDGGSSDANGVPFHSKKNGADNSEDKEEDDDEEGGEEDDVYVVEKILGHKFERGTLKLEVKWQGYDDPSDRTWETESNLQTAPEAVAEYFEDLGGRPERPGKKKAAAAAAGPGRKRRISGVESPASAPGSSKRGRPPRRKSSAPADEEDGSEEASGGGVDDYKSLKKLGYPQEHDWDPHIQQVVTIEQQADPKGGKNLKYAKVIWKDERRENVAIPLSIAHKRFPQKMLSFYESHLAFANPQG